MIFITNSTRRGKKLMVIGLSRKIHFGAKGYSDYTIHNDPQRKASYDKRHGKVEDWSNPNAPGFWAKWILWNKPTIEQSIKDVENRLGVIIINKIK